MARQRLYEAKKAAKEISTLKEIEELERLAKGAEQPHKGSGKGKKRSPPSSDSDDSSSDSDSSTSSGTSSNEEVSTVAVPQSTATGASEVFQQCLQEKGEGISVWVYVHSRGCSSCRLGKVCVRV